MAKRFEVTRVSGMPVSDDDLLADLRRAAENLGQVTIGQKQYRGLGPYDDSRPLTRYHGVLAPGSSWRRQLVADASAPSDACEAVDCAHAHAKPPGKAPAHG